jgi:hypothetical protein
MSATNSSLPQAEPDVNVRYYSTPVNARTRAAQARLTPEQIAAANEHAARLRAQDAVLLRGPVEDNGMIQVPSWRWNPELVREIKSRTGYHYEKEWPYTIRVRLHGHDYTPTVSMPTWTVPAEPGRLEAIRAVYELVFAREIAQARMTEMLAPLGRI